jgi:hypothetical protein
MRHAHHELVRAWRRHGLIVAAKMRIRQLSARTFRQHPAAIELRHGLILPILLIEDQA